MGTTAALASQCGVTVRILCLQGPQATLTLAACLLSVSHAMHVFFMPTAASVHNPVIFPSTVPLGLHWTNSLVPSRAVVRFAN